MIRQILKAEFPGKKFSVTSDYNSILIRYRDGVATEKVEALTDKFEMGDFNSMEDIYEYSNRNPDLPQVKYVFIDREMSQEAEAAIIRDLKIQDPTSYHGGLMIYEAFKGRDF